MAEPVIPDAITDEEVRQFASVLTSQPSPALGFCRTGMRAIRLWALASLETHPQSYVLEKAAAAGYDLEDYLRERDADEEGGHGGEVRVEPVY